MSKKPYEGAELPTNPRLPTWILTPKEERVIFERWRKKAFARCDDLIKAYIDCSNAYPNPVEGMKECEAANQKLLDCVKHYQTMKYLDEERDILIADKKLKQKIWHERLKEAQNAKATGAEN